MLVLIKQDVATMKKWLQEARLCLRVRVPKSCTGLVVRRKVFERWKLSSFGFLMLAAIVLGFLVMMWFTREECTFDQELAGLCSTINAACTSKFEKLPHSYRAELVLRTPSQSLLRSQTLILPWSPRPEVSVIVVYNGRYWDTFNTARRVLETTANVSFEMILIDDGTDEETAGQNWLVERIRGAVVHLRSPHSIGLIRALNAAMHHVNCRSRFVALLSNDVVVQNGWLESLRNTFLEHENVGLVGSKLLSGGRLQEAGRMIWSTGSTAIYGLDHDASRPEYNYVRDVDYCRGSAMMVDLRLLSGREYFFDPRYEPAYNEDIDLAMEIHHMKHRVLYQPAAVVEIRDTQHDARYDMVSRNHQYLNRMTFTSKWEQRLKHTHIPNNCSQHLARDRVAVERNGLRVLIIDHLLPSPDRDSGSLRIFNIISLLQEHRCAITFMAEVWQDEPLEYVRMLQRRGVEVLHKPYYTSMEQVRATHPDFDILYISRVSVYAEHYQVVHSIYPEALVVFDTVDLVFLRLAREAKLTGKPFDEKARIQELSYLQQADMSIVVSSFEYNLLLKQYHIPASKLLKLSNVHNIEPSAPSFYDRSGILFIAHFQHPPNIDGIEWYIKSIHPLVRAQVPEAVLKIVGDKIELLPTWIHTAEGVEVLGHIPDTRSIYAQVKMSVAPLRYGAGVKGKVSQSLARGVPVVGTTIAAEGMDLTDEEDMMVADDPEEFAEKVVRLWNSYRLWNKLREDGFKRVEALFSRQAGREALRPLIETARSSRTERSSISGCIAHCC